MAEALARYRARLCGEITQALNDAARETASQARQAAPVRTGALRDSIAPEEAVWQGDAAFSAVVAAAPYALLVELGTSRARPQPFLRPAARRAGEALVGRLRG